MNLLRLYGWYEAEMQGGTPRARAREIYLNVEYIVTIQEYIGDDDKCIIVTTVDTIYVNESLIQTLDRMTRIGK